MGSSASDAMVVLKNGNIGIGDSTPTEATLVVNGTIRASGTITQNAILTPDYVFEKYYLNSSSLNPDYRMPTLDEVARFTKENYHLPGVPSASERAKTGINLGRATEINLEKVEELFLHTIAQQKEINALKSENANYKKVLKAVLKRLAALENE